MLVKDIISDTIPEISLSDSGMKALYWMDIFRISHLPIVKKKELLGIIADKDIYDYNMADNPIGNYKISLVCPYVYKDQHVYEAIGLASKMKLSLVPVVDEDKNYKGVVTVDDMMHYVAKLTSVDQPGGLIILEISENDYVLSQIAQIAETNNTKVLSLNLNKPKDSSKMEVILKVNRVDIASLLQTFERYGYEVKATYSVEEEMDEYYGKRYDEFIRYLNV